MLKICEFDLKQDVCSSDGTVIKTINYGKHIALFDTEMISEDDVAKILEQRSEVISSNNVLFFSEKAYKLLEKMIKNNFKPKQHQISENI